MNNAGNGFVDKVIKQIEHLPTLPQVVMKVLEMTESADISTRELSKSLDQSLSAKVLKLANSAYYGMGSRNANTVQRAIIIIGFDAVKEIILLTSLFHTLKDTKEMQTLQPLWQHSLECAVIAKRLAWIYRYPEIDEAYLSGLIHDIGKLIIQQYFPDQYQQIKKKEEEGIKPLQAEKEILGVTHAEIGGRISTQWVFPEALVEAVAHHHDARWKLNPKLGMILHYADRFVSGSLDFPGLLEAFNKEGMSHPEEWIPADLQSVENIFHEEMTKAKSIFNFTVNIE